MVNSDTKQLPRLGPPWFLEPGQVTDLRLITGAKGAWPWVRFGMLMGTLGVLHAAPLHTPNSCCTWVCEPGRTPWAHWACWVIICKDSARLRLLITASLNGPRRWQIPVFPQQGSSWESVPPSLKWLVCHWSHSCSHYRQTTSFPPVRES